MAKLLNSAMMPNLNGTYEINELSHEQFCDRVKLAVSLESYIGYPQNAKLIEEWTGIPISVNRDQASLVDGDQILAMRLKYRPDIVDKSKLVNPDDFEYAFIRYYHKKEV